MDADRGVRHPAVETRVGHRMVTVTHPAWVSRDFSTFVHPNGVRTGLSSSELA
jgi:hypothetical protein